MIAICLEPYHEHAYPLMLEVDEIEEAMRSPNEQRISLSVPNVTGRLHFVRTPDGHINNCALANGENEESCQICPNHQCPDRARS